MTERPVTDELGNLEANANGEWGWLTDVVDLPIAGALADLLLDEVPS